MKKIFSETLSEIFGRLQELWGGYCYPCGFAFGGKSGFGLPR